MGVCIKAHSHFFVYFFISHSFFSYICKCKKCNYYLLKTFNVL